MMFALRNALVTGSLLMLAGCRTAESTFNTHGPAAHRIAQLSWFMVILFLVITVIMWVLFGYAFCRGRGTLTQHEPIDAKGGEGWIAWGGVVIPFIVLTVLFVLGLGRTAAWATRSGQRL